MKDESGHNATGTTDQFTTIQELKIWAFALQLLHCKTKCIALSYFREKKVISLWLVGCCAIPGFNCTRKRHKFLKKIALQLC